VAGICRSPRGSGERELRDAALERSASDEPGPGRQVAIANYADYDDFLYRLPKYLGDVNRRLEERLRKTDYSEAPMRAARREIRATRRRASKPLDVRTQAMKANEPKPESA
jgi:hypothetical protein